MLARTCAHQDYLCSFYVITFKADLAIFTLLEYYNLQFIHCENVDKDPVHLLQFKVVKLTLKYVVIKSKDISTPVPCVCVCACVFIMTCLYCAASMCLPLLSCI